MVGASVVRGGTVGELAGVIDCGSFRKQTTVEKGVPSRASLKAEGAMVDENLTKEISESRLQGSRATEASVPSDLKNPRQVRFDTWEKEARRREATRFASSAAEADELTGMLSA